MQERIKQRRHMLYQEKMQQLEDREIKHAEIDKAMEQIIRKQTVEKQVDIYTLIFHTN